MAEAEIEGDAPRIVVNLLLASIRMHHKLTALGRQIGAVTGAGGEWGVLHTLVEHGPQTVPAIANMRPVARQHIQTIVNSLKQKGFVTIEPNPRHARSGLVALTEAGLRHHDGLYEKFLQMGRQLAGGLPDDSLAKALEIQELLLDRLDQMLNIVPAARHGRVETGDDDVDK
jgi:DNA-binding MarR family transcriptional regulator